MVRKYLFYISSFYQEYYNFSSIKLIEPDLIYKYYYNGIKL